MILDILFPRLTFTAYALSKGVNESLAYQLLAVMNAAQIPGRAIPGKLTDRRGRFNVTYLSSLAVWLPANNTGSIIAFSVLSGLLSRTASS
jgi:hypothetical protein